MELKKFNRGLDLMEKHGISRSSIRGMFEPFYSTLEQNHTLGIMKFDNYLHEHYGDYENEGKSIEDMFKEIFKEDADFIAENCFAIYISFHEDIVS